MPRIGVLHKLQIGMDKARLPVREADAPILPAVAYAVGKFGDKMLAGEKLAAFLALPGHNEGIGNKIDDFPAARPRFREALRNVLGERAPLLPEGGVFLWLDTAPFSGDKARSLLAARGVLVVSGQEFCLRRRTERAVRLCVARLGLRELDEAAGILGTLVGR